MKYSESQNLVAIDLGASNGRVVLGRLYRKKLTIEVVHRFDHNIRLIGGHRRWDWTRIHEEIWSGLARAAECVGNAPIASVSCDAWAQDFGLLNAQGELFYPPVSYRDPRTKEIPAGYFDHISPAELIARVGGCIAPMTTLCQLYVMARDEPDVLEKASTLLHIADLVHYELCGVPATDWTLATASMLRNLKTQDWDRELLERMRIPCHMLPRLVNKPMVLGRISKDRAPHPCLSGVPVIVAANHDTPAATAAVSPMDKETIFLSAGTYAMLCCISDEPRVPRDPAGTGYALLGVSQHRWGLFSSVAGLWIIQECRRIWGENKKNISYEELVQEAKLAEIDSVVHFSDTRFHAPENMPEEIRKVCVETGVRPPETQGEFAKIVFDSIAKDCGNAVSALSEETGRRFHRMHIVSGGSRNAYLCQRIADEIHVPVLAGPAEATAIGNLILQARLMNLIPSDEASAQVLSASFPQIRYEPTTQESGVRGQESE